MPTKVCHKGAFFLSQKDFDYLAKGILGGRATMEVGERWYGPGCWRG